MRLRDKLVILLLLVTLLPLVAAMGLAIWHTSGQVRNLTLWTAGERVVSAAEELSGYFDARRSEVGAYAHSPRVRRMNWQEIGPWFRAEVMRHDGIYEKLLLGLPSGHYYVTARGNPWLDGRVSFDDASHAAEPKSIASRPYWRYLVGENRSGAARRHVSNPMISYSTGVRQVIVGATVLSDSGEVLGMVGGGIPWDEIEKRISAIRDQILSDFGASVRVVLIDADGIYVYHWDPERVVHLELDADGQPLVNDIGEKSVVLHRITEEPTAELAEAGARMMEGGAGHVVFRNPDTGDEEVLLYAPVDSARYSIAMILPERVIMSPVATLRKQFMVVFVSAVVFCGVVALLLARRMSRRVVALSAAASRIAEGQWETRVETSGRDEIHELGGAFNRMAQDLGDYIQRLAREQAKAARIEHDLQMAREIQTGLLPREQLRIEGFDVAGWNQPADETGGDYYDWQLLPGGRWAISVADVTGHGIGPALVTAFCRAYSRACLPLASELGAGVDRINDLIQHDLTDGRFVTLAVAIIDPARKDLALFSAGHGPLFLYRAADHAVEIMNAMDIPLGVEAGVGYGPATRIRLDPGDILVLLTDGFLEWMNERREQFGAERVAEIIRTAGGVPAKEIIDRLHSAVQEFAGGTTQADDLTAVVIRRPP